MTARTFSFAFVAAFALTAGLAGQASAQFNPVIGGTLPQTTVIQNPFFPGVHIHQDSHQVHLSALDPFRNQIAPGSLRQVNRTFIGPDGAWYRQQGVEWRNAVNGRPHSQVTTTRISGGMGGFTQSQSITSHRSMAEPRTQGRSSSTRRGW